MDWIQFFDDNRIDYVTRSPNVKRGNVNCRCPWCGDDDPSHHLGISLTSDAFGCWRNASHKGRKPQFLVGALLGCSLNQAKLVVTQYSTSDPSNLDEAITLLTEVRTEDKSKVNIQLPEARQNIRPVGSTSRFWYYLKQRGFDDVAELCRLYYMTCCQTGRCKDRIIIPVHDNTALIGWTSRALQDPVNAPRYLSSGPELKDTIFNSSAEGNILFITEGPFDAMKVDFYGRELGARAICTFGTSVIPNQIFLLREMATKFNHTIILFDYNVVEPVFALSDWLPAAIMGTDQMPDGVKDPGEMTKNQVLSLIKFFL